jgi:hypothetical protein
MFNNKSGRDKVFSSLNHEGGQYEHNDSSHDEVLDTGRKIPIYIDPTTPVVPVKTT